MLTAQQKRVARDLYRRGLRVESITNGNTVVYDNDAQAAFLKDVESEGNACGVTEWDEFSSACGATYAAQLSMGRADENHQRASVVYPLVHLSRR